jgi:hypothetical protein
VPAEPWADHFLAKHITVMTITTTPTVTPTPIEIAFLLDAVETATARMTTPFG